MKHNCSAHRLAVLSSEVGKIIRSSHPLMKV